MSDDKAKRSDDTVILTAEMLSSSSTDQAHMGCKVASFGPDRAGLLQLWCLKHKEWTYIAPVSRICQYPGVLPDQLITY